MTLLLSFPSEAPYRIDQVTTNPEAMLALAIGQLLQAACMGWWLSRRWWWLGSGLVALSKLVFNQANWGTRDITHLATTWPFHAMRCSAELNHVVEATAVHCGSQAPSSQLPS